MYIFHSSQSILFPRSIHFYQCPILARRRWTSPTTSIPSMPPTLFCRQSGVDVERHRAPESLLRSSKDDLSNRQGCGRFHHGFSIGCWLKVPGWRHHLAGTIDARHAVWQPHEIFVQVSMASPWRRLKPTLMFFLGWIFHPLVTLVFCFLPIFFFLWSNGSSNCDDISDGPIVIVVLRSLA